MTPLPLGHFIEHLLCTHYVRFTTPDKTQIGVEHRNLDLAFWPSPLFSLLFLPHLYLFLSRIGVYKAHESSARTTNPLISPSSLKSQPTPNQIPNGLGILGLMLLLINFLLFERDSHFSCSRFVHA